MTIGGTGHRPAEQLGRFEPAVGTRCQLEPPPVPKLQTAMPKHCSETGRRCAKIKQRKFSNRKLISRGGHGPFFSHSQPCVCAAGHHHLRHVQARLILVHGCSTLSCVVAKCAEFVHMRSASQRPPRGRPEAATEAAQRPPMKT